MKKFNLTAASILLIIAPTLLSAYSAKKINDQPISADYYYTSANHLIQTGRSTSLDVTELGDLNYWSTDPQPITYSESRVSLRAISFDHETISDGGADGQLSLKEAINALKDYYIINLNFPSDECIVIDKAAIKVKR